MKNRHILDGKRMLGSFGTVLNLITYSLKDLLEDKQLMLNFSKVYIFRLFVCLMSFLWF